MEQSLLKAVHEKYKRKQYPVKILQFGSGNFLRGFADWMIQEMNEKTGFNAGVSVVQSISNSDLLSKQYGAYTLTLKGLSEGKMVSHRCIIDVIQRVVNPINNFDSFLIEALNPDLQFIISNTTEAGIVFSELDRYENPASTFPGKLTQLLFHRFNNKLDNPLVVLPTELIEQNGSTLKACVIRYCKHWALPQAFEVWINSNITFCNTLVDRIVSGFSKKPKAEVFEELGYVDELAVEGEWFHLWVIEGPESLEKVLPFKKAGLNIIYTNDLDSYRLRKVRILNAAHTVMACVGYLAGLKTVREAIDHPQVGKFITDMIHLEVIPQIPGDLSELAKYAEETFNRFRNTSIDHQLLSINLNAFSKFGVRVLPSILNALKRNGVAPDRLSFSFAALIHYYRGTLDGKSIPLKDNEEVIAFMKSVWGSVGNSEAEIENVCRRVLCRREWWGRDLTEDKQLVQKTATNLFEIDQKGILERLRELSASTT